MKTLGNLHPTDLVQPSDSVATMVAVAATAQSFDVPSGAGSVLFSASVDFFARFGSTAASIPSTSAAATTNPTTNSELNPTARNFVSTASCTVISLISPTSGYITMAFYSRGAP